MDRIRAKSQKLMDLFAELVDTRCADIGMTLISPREHARRGSHLSYSHPHGYELTQALRQRRVVPDFRAPDLIRLGFTPLTMSYADVWDAVDRLSAIWREGAWRDPRHAVKAAVT
jgi:kynureninase